MCIAVTRSFKNTDGEYETDFIDVVLYSSIAENTKEYSFKGDLVGVKGRLQNIDGSTKIIGEKITFLSSKKEDTK